MVALAVLNKGYFRLRVARLELQEIAVMSAEFGFEVRGVFVAGEDNPADQLSRGPSVSLHDWTFSEFEHFGVPRSGVDCCADESGYNARCLEWFSAADPMQLHVANMVGRHLWANPPYQIVGANLDALVAAWSQDRANTVATIILPYFPQASWFRHYFTRRNRLFKTLALYQVGSKFT